MRYHIIRDSKVVGKFTLKPDAVRYAKAVSARKNVEKVTIRDARIDELVSF